MLKLARGAVSGALVIVPVSTIELSAASLTVKAGSAEYPTPEAITSNLIDPEETASLSKNSLESGKPLAVTVKVMTGSTVDSFVTVEAMRAISGNTL